MRQTISDYFSLDKTQSELDFVDVPADGDLPLFVDPFAISLRPDRWSQDCSRIIQDFFQRVVELLRAGRLQDANSLLGFLGEPNETHLGLSKERPRGAGIGKGQAEQLVQALSESAAVTSGFVSHLEETELMIPGVGRDKISDLTTNLIRGRLARYTYEQCHLLGIPTQEAALPPFYDPKENRWVSDYFELPVTQRGPLVLVPKVIVRYDLAYDHQSYYHNFVVDFLRAEQLEARTSLVHTLKNGRAVVYKKDLTARFPITKEFLYKFSKEHTDVLKEYRKQLAAIEKSIDTPVQAADEPKIAFMLQAALRAILPGSDSAGTYHSLMIGVVEFLFFPQLLHPVKEKEIHEGRKRIDILMENGARVGKALHALHEIKKIPCSFIPIECKNYVTEVGNPEVDQLGGRFSTNRGQFGMLCCRTFENRGRFLKRCRDTFADGRGLIIPLDDAEIVEMLRHVAARRREAIDDRLWSLITEVIV